MTYLQLVNKVLRRMRESQVAMVSESQYSLLIGEFVNDAKRLVEDAWPWRALVDSVIVTTVNGTESYDLEDFNCVLSGAPPRENARLYIDPQVSVPMIRLNTDNDEALVLKATPFHEFIERVRQSNDSSVATPDSVFFTTNQDAASGLSNIRMRAYPTPDAAYDIEVFLVNPQNDLSADSDVLLVPYHPVIQLAYLYALYERGEEVGEALTLTSEKADNSLADAIMHDSSLTSELIFRT